MGGMYTIIGGDGREYGPATAEQIRQWIAGGRAGLETKAKAAGGEEWKPLSEFPEIVAAGIEPPPLEGAAPAALDLPHASRLARLIARIIDSIIYSICLLPWFLSGGWHAFMEAVQTHNPDLLQTMPGVMMGSSVTGLLFMAVGLTQIILLSLRGQTVGKLLCGVRIVRYPTGAPAGFVRAWLLRYFVMSVFIFLLSLIPILGLALPLTDILFIFRPDRRCLHDHLAGTMVVPT